MPVYDIFVISDDVAGQKMAGPGIRAWELARCLAQKFKVILAVPDYSYKSKEHSLSEGIDFEIIDYSLKESSLIERIGNKSRIILIQGYVLSKFPIIKTLPAHLICDLYVPFPLETLFIHQKKIQSQKDREYMHLRDLNIFNDQMKHGTIFCVPISDRETCLRVLLWPGTGSIPVTWLKARFWTV
jgi:hypothetical protein